MARAALEEALNPQFLASFGTLASVTVSLAFLQARREGQVGQWFPCQKTNPQKRACELWFLGYGVFWIACFGLIIGGKLYTWFDKIHYIVVCCGLAAPLLLQPLIAAWITHDSGCPLLERHSFKANLWIAIFSFIGNYWYTHYFYSVLQARYTFPSWDFNGVPIAMFFATHFYFCFYHALSNCVLRKVETTYACGWRRTAFTAAVVCLMAYTTAYMETLTISGFPCYSFPDRTRVYSLGSAFYGIYFIVSFPMFYRLCRASPQNDKLRTATEMEAKRGGHTWFDAAVESLATGMLVLLLLDFVRVALGQDLQVTLLRPCKLDASTTCAPFTGNFC